MVNAKPLLRSVLFTLQSSETSNISTSISTLWDTPNMDFVYDIESYEATTGSSEIISVEGLAGLLMSSPLGLQR